MSTVCREVEGQNDPCGLALGIQVDSLHYKLKPWAGNVKTWVLRDRLATHSRTEARDSARMASDNHRCCPKVPLPYTWVTGTNTSMYSEEKTQGHHQVSGHPSETGTEMVSTSEEEVSMKVTCSDTADPSPAFPCSLSERGFIGQGLCSSHGICPPPSLFQCHICQALRALLNSGFGDIPSRCSSRPPQPLRWSGRDGL